MAHRPRVSVCVSAYNAGQHIRESLESILAQSFEDLEVIVVDDGSTDDTVEVVTEFLHVDDRVRLLANGVNKGLVFTRNRALSEARGDLVAIADADDISEPQRLAVQVSIIEENPDIGVLGSDVTLIDAHGVRIGSHSQQCHLDRHIRCFLMFGPCLHNPTTIYRRSLLTQLGGYAAGFDGGAEDYDLWGRLSGITHLANTPEKLVRYRKHANSVTADRTLVDKNIFVISAGLLTKYLEVPVGNDDARLLHRWSIKEGMSVADCRIAFRLAQSIWHCAVPREQPDTLALLGNHFGAAAWRHAQYMVYADRLLSLELASFAFRLPRVPHREGILTYARRLVMPRAARSLVKSLSRRF